VPIGTTLPIIGFQIPADCGALCPPRITQCGIERVCDPAIIAAARVDITATLTPVLSGVAFAVSVTTPLTPGSVAAPITVLGTPIAVRFTNILRAQFDPKKFGEPCCPSKCKLKFDVCSCDLCPIFACFEDTQTVTTTPLGGPAAAAITTPAASICIARTFHQLDAARVCIRKRNRKVRPPRLTSVTPGCIDLPLLTVAPTVGVPGMSVTIPFANSATCVTLNGCNLNNVAAVLFNNQICAEIISVNPNSIVVHVPCVAGAGGTIPGFPLTSGTGAAPIPFQASIAVVDFCGKLSNAVSLQIACPTDTMFTLGASVGLGCNRF